ncbi:unnamed protein product [Sphagnum jensenii]|uniref:Uncharacterized protein n=1 Tax=Sphagnum jensenii TaxID=128206 RepID=A0ABP0VGH4_9BRYO
MSNVGDVSHVEIDTEQKQAAVYLKEKREEALDEIEKHSSQGGDVTVTKKPVILQKHDIINLPWELEPEKLTLFILNHNAWLSPLNEDGYKLEFRGGLLGGGGVQSTGGGGGRGTYPHTINVYPGRVDCGNRNDWPKGTIGERFCNKNGNGAGNFGIPVINKPYVPPVDKEWQNHCEKISNNPFGKQKIAYHPSVKDDKSDLAEVNVNPKIRQILGKEVYAAIRPLIDGFHKGEVQDIVRKIPDLTMEALSNYQGGDLSQKTIDEIVRNIGLYIDPRIKQTGSFRILNPADYYRILDKDRRWMGKEVDKVSRKAVSCAYEGLKKQYADELEKLKKKQKLEEEEREKARQYERDSSLAGSSLFKNVPPQYQVTPEYFEQSASDAGLMPSQALHIILNPTSENFYDRTILTSRQNWLGGAKNTIAFVFEDLTNEQPYKYISQGYHKGDFPTLSHRLVCQRGSSLFNDVTSEYFSNQAAKAKMTSIQALGILVNPTPENFYDRVMLTSRQSWLGGAENTMAFGFEGLTNEQAYKYISQGYKPQDFPTLSNRLVSQRGATLFENVTPDYFVKQAEKTGMTPMQSLAILMNPTLENAYERVLLSSRQSYLGGTHDLFVFRDMGVTVGEAYDHLLTHIKNKESFSQLLDDNTNKAIKEGFTQFCRERYQDLYGSFYGEYEKVKHLQYLINTTAWEGVYNYAETEGFSKEDVHYVESRRKETVTFDGYLKEVFDDQVLEHLGVYDFSIIPVGKMQKTDPMSPYDFFDLEGKMGGSGMMAGGAGGGKLGWGRIFANQKKLSEQQIKTANNVIQKIQHRTRLQLQDKGILDAKGNLTKKSIKNSVEVKIKEPLKNPDVIKELTKNERERVAIELYRKEVSFIKGESYEPLPPTKPDAKELLEIYRRRERDGLIPEQGFNKNFEPTALTSTTEWRK